MAEQEKTSTNGDTTQVAASKAGKLDLAKKTDGDNGRNESGFRLLDCAPSPPVIWQFSQRSSTTAQLRQAIFGSWSILVVALFSPATCSS